MNINSNTNDKTSKIKLHLSRMAERQAEARANKEQKRLDGLAKRDQHNMSLRQKREQRRNVMEEVKTLSLRALGSAV
jgi:hypothetical protein